MNYNSKYAGLIIMCRDYFEAVLCVYFKKEFITRYVVVFQPWGELSSIRSVGLIS